MEIQDDTEALRQLFMQMEPEIGDVESVHKAELDPEAALTLMANPKAALKAMNIPVSAESHVQITMKNRADREVDDALTAARTARLRRIIVIVIHYRNCDSDIIIIATRS
ncbi:hypothetical protein [Massilia endophytica]|uniref:hypothetical protein n=1 Tax=Massilia endophytica TaxID=2899220 RepID=UPI001E3CDF4A|nr:hypothetical protein [Massilia endophytica]UGQ48758.1 hypothetical protein LSQ66_09940 [Massilia endophytica]